MTRKRVLANTFFGTSTIPVLLESMGPYSLVMRSIGTYRLARRSEAESGTVFWCARAARPIENKRFAFCLEVLIRARLTRFSGEFL